MRKKVCVAGLLSGLCMIFAFRVSAQQLADTTQLSALGSWPSVALNDSAYAAKDPAQAPLKSSPKAANLKTNAVENNAVSTLVNSRQELKKLNLTLKNNPKNVAAYTERGKLKFQLNKTGGAIKDFTVAINLAPDEPETYYYRGLAFLKANDYLGAVSDLTKRLNAEPAVNCFIARAKAKALLLDYRGAIIDNSKALELEAENEEALYNRAVARFYLKDYTKAIEDFTTILERNKNLAETYFFRGLSKHKSGDIESGCLDLSKAGELGFEEAYESIKELCR